MTRIRMTPETQARIDEHALSLRRALRRAGDPSYETLRRMTGYSKPTISRILNGHHFPKWDFVRAFLQACGIDPAEIADRYEPRWQEIAEMLAPLGKESEDLAPPAAAQARECPECGALTGNPLRHQAWHAAIAREDVTAPWRGTGGTVHRLSG